MNKYSIIRYLPLAILRTIAKMVAFIINHQSNLKINRTIHTNLQLAYPHLSASQRQQLQQQTIIYQALSTVESAKSWAMPPAWSMAQIKQVHGFEHLQYALQNPNGTLLIVPHLGTWEMMNAWVAQHTALTIMYKPVEDVDLNQFILAGRQRLNATLVPTDATGVKAILKALKQGGCTVILPDHVPDISSGVVVPFFGIPTISSTLASKLASKTRCSLVGLSCIRRENHDGFDLYCDILDDERIYHADNTVATQALNQAMQQMINRFPAHYMWNYKRFKHVPNIDNIYALTDDELQQLVAEYSSINQS